jgi:hypothetical protein
VIGDRALFSVLKMALSLQSLNEREGDTQISAELVADAAILVSEFPLIKVWTSGLCDSRS